MSVSSPTPLVGGIRNVLFERNAIQAILDRAGIQSSENLQTAKAFSGAQVSNDLTQSETLNQEGSAILTETVTVTPPVPPAAGVPQKFLDNFNFLNKVSTIARTVDFLTRGQGLNTQNQRVGQVALSDGMGITAVNSNASNTLTQTAAILQTLAQTGINTNFIAQLGTLPIVTARERETIVESNNSITEGILNITQSQGGAPSVTAQPGAIEVITSQNAFEDATTGPGNATPTTTLNDLTLNTQDYVPGDKILITGEDFGGVPITATFIFGGSPVAEQVNGNKAITVGGTPSTLLTTLTSTDVTDASTYADGDTISITGTDSNGSAISPTSFVFGAGTGQDGTTVGNLVSKISSAFPGATASLDSSGKIVLTADTPGDVTPDLALTLENQTSNVGNKTAGAFDTFTNVTQGVDQGNGETLGDLIAFINGGGNGPNVGDKFPNATLTLSNGELVLTSDSVGTANLAVTLADDANNTGASAFASNLLVETTEGEAPTPGSILLGASFQLATANGGSATNFLTETASNTQFNTVANTHTIDVRRISGTTQAALTPRPSSIQILVNSPLGTGKLGQINKVSNRGTAIQNQALIQTSLGGMDENGNPTDMGGNVSNTAAQLATSFDKSTVSEVTTIMA